MFKSLNQMFIIELLFPVVMLACILFLSRSFLNMRSCWYLFRS
ncbi:Uncharacterised protein [Klebsiella pneumoniae]|nr:Uncharacterised protein [Klebsiella pneumoniae]